VEVNVFFRLHICSGHYAHKVAGWRLFDHKKPYCNAKLFGSSGKLFFSLFVIFLLLVTFINYFLLLRKAKGIISLYLLHCLRGAGAPIHMI
jgi:hypothetical protein